MVSRLTCLILLAGCTAHLRPHPDVRISAEALPLKAVLVVPTELNQSIDKVGGFDGIAGSYAFDTGELLVPAVKDVASRVFQSVEIVAQPSAAPKADVVIIVKRLKLVHPRSDLTLRFDFSAKVENAEGIQILDAVYNEELKAVVARDASDAITSPTEKAIAATLERLATDLRASAVALVPPPKEPDPVVVAEAAAEPVTEKPAAPDFSEFPPPPPLPPGAEPKKEEAPTPAPAPAAVAATPVAAPAPTAAVTIEKPASSGRGSKAVLITSGLLLLGAGYAAPLVLPRVVNVPAADSDLTYIPFAGALISTLQNPYLSQDPAALAVAIGCTAAQVAGAALTIAGIAKRSGPRVAVVPTLGSGSAGVALTVY